MSGPQGQRVNLIRAIQDSKSQLVISPYLLEEVQRVLHYPRMQAIYPLSDSDVWEHIRFLESISEIVEPAVGPPIVLKDVN